MDPGIARGLVTSVAIYLAVGSLVGIPFVISGIRRVDPVTQGTRWTFRALVFPGVVALWPLMTWRWLRARRMS